MSIGKLSIRQVKAARALLSWSQEDLAEAAEVSVPTIARLESADGPLGGRASTVSAIRQAFEAEGIVFTQEGEAWGVSLHPKA